MRGSWLRSIVFSFLVHLKLGHPSRLTMKTILLGIPWDIWSWKSEPFFAARSLPNSWLPRSPEVELCGYSIPHPSEAKLNLRIQTYGKLPNALGLAHSWAEQRGQQCLRCLGKGAWWSYGIVRNRNREVQGSKEWFWCRGGLSVRHGRPMNPTWAMLHGFSRSTTLQTLREDVFVHSWKFE